VHLVDAHALVNSFSKLFPQQNNVPLLWRAHVCSRPAATATMPLSTVSQLTVKLQVEQVQEEDATQTF
jgi:hypothetical protein